MFAKPDMGQKLFVQLSMQYNQVKQSNSGCQRMLENFDNLRITPPQKKKKKRKKERRKEGKKERKKERKKRKEKKRKRERRKKEKKKGLVLHVLYPLTTTPLT